MYSRHYILWGMERFARRLLAYMIMLPIILTIWPVMTIGDWLCNYYYRNKEW